MRALPNGRLMKHDIIAIGGSAGALDALFEIVGAFPADLRAAVFVAIHVHPTSESSLPELLTRRGLLPAKQPTHGETIVPGHIYVAPPDNHLIVRAGVIEVSRGPKENGQRPAVDALFRSASNAFGPRVVGVVLSGHLDCGTAGSMSIKARGGVTIAQSPDDAKVAEMPSSAIRRKAIDHVLPARDIGPLLVELSDKPAGPTVEPPPDVFRLEGREPGKHAEIVCPACHGVLQEWEVSSFHRFRCRVGHAFSLETLVAEQGEELERALWAAVRSLEDSAGLARRLSGTSMTELQTRFAERADTQMREADAIRRFLLDGEPLSSADAPPPGS